jgi:hypothetical protein
MRYATDTAHHRFPDKKKYIQRPLIYRQGKLEGGVE